jgi:hypothetical protein
MQHILAFVQATQPASGLDRVIVPTLTLLIYGLLGPAVYLTIVLVGVELAWPSGTRMRRWLQKHRTSECPTTSDLAADPNFRIECVVAGLIALSMWSVVITAWLAGYLRSVHAPQLTISEYSPRHVADFVITLLIGVLSGFIWADGMRRAASPRASLAVLSISMSLAGTLLFFYALEPGLRDILIVLSLGIFSGELAVAARHPTFLTEGLFAELFIPPEYSDEEWQDEQAGVEAAEPQEGARTPGAAPAADGPAAAARSAPGSGDSASAASAASATRQLGPDPTTGKFIPDEQQRSPAAQGKPR